MLYRPKYTTSVPKNATITKRKGVRYATWEKKEGRKKDRKSNKTITAEIKTHEDGKEYVTVETAYYYARYKDSVGRTVTRNTKCTDRTAAANKLSEWQGITTKVRHGELSRKLERKDYKGPALFADTQNDYLEALRRGWSAKKKKTHPASESHLYFVERVLNEYKAHSNIHRLVDFDMESVNDYLGMVQERKTRTGKVCSARYYNHHRSILSGFATYCEVKGLLQEHPVRTINTLDVEGDKRRTPRALSDEEVARLLVAAEHRPLDNFRNKNTGPVDPDKIKPTTIEDLKRKGRERRLVYLVLLTTGLRWNELRAVHVHDCVLNGIPHIKLKASGTKGRRSDTVPLTKSLAAELHQWTVDTGRIGKARLFDIADKGITVFDKDIEAAKIPKETDKGIACVHSLRHTCATRLAKSNVPVKIASQIMRHRDINLTMKFYTHLEQIDTHNAVEGLPQLPEIEEKNADTETA